jgi:23S rRNA pseudouridine1911/1915/1917 synthase
MMSQSELPSSDSEEDDFSVELPLDAGSAQPVEITVESRAHGWRLDHYLGRLFPNHSRAQLQRIIDSGSVLLNGLPHKASRRLRVNDRLHVQLVSAERPSIEPEDLPVTVLYEDDALVVVSKPAGMVVHPGRGSSRGTLAAALQHHFDALSDVAGRHRPGIVHRLDRDTTGVILIAKDNQVHQKIAAQFERREVKKQYHAIVRGNPQLDSDYIRTWMSTHPKVRERMMVCPRGGDAREAVTFYRTAERFERYSLMELHPQTGRTHQLRVHMQHLGHPIIADKLYTGISELREADLHATSTGSVAQTADKSSPVLIARQALHAFRLTIRHPVTGESMQFEAPWPEDFQKTVDALRSTQAERSTART